MIDKSVAKRLAIQCGAGQYSAYCTSVVMNPDELQAFAQAAVENYKASLVPVGVVMNRRLFVSPGIDLRNFADDTPLYVLKETK